MSDQRPARPNRKKRRPDNLPEIVSPCVSICEMDQEAGLCKGCYRTLEEIATWSRIANDKRWDIIQELRERRRNYLPD